MSLGAVTSTGEAVCPIAHTLRVLGTTKWTGYVIRELLPGPKAVRRDPGRCG
jgi:DNA-binding HxlR family transcriptional regulator